MQLSTQNQIEPLSELRVYGVSEGFLSVRDAQGIEYIKEKASEPFSFTVSGFPGTHVVFHLDSEGRILTSLSFKVRVETSLEESSGQIANLLADLRWTMESWLESPAHGGTNDFMSRIDGKIYRYFVRWLRDHVHSLKGQKYFHHGDLQSAIDLYSLTQRQDGMIYDRIDQTGPEPQWRDYSFKDGDFVKPLEHGKYRMQRIPVENDVEFLFLEGLYYTWKATGDDKWMKSKLENAKKAVSYATSDVYRFSKKYQLLKRGYTIDTWDFMSNDDKALTKGDNVVDPEKSIFGVMHGDNTGFARGLDFLAEMLKYSGQEEDAAYYQKMADDFRLRLEETSWNGNFFTHHVSEDPSFKRDLGGTEEEKQVSLSNSYAINRNIDHEKAVKIIKTYQKIREEMPESSPGEFYNIYPPFEKGFNTANSKWHYMNGGVSTIVAGELAHGAFEHGFETYAFDILSRVIGWSKKYKGFLPVVLRGCAEETKQRRFTHISLKSLANVDFCGKGNPEKGIKGWTDEGPNDLGHIPTGKQEFLAVPFDVINPKENSGCAAIGLASREGYLKKVEIPVDLKAESFYFLHTMARQGFCGSVIFRYQDGSEHVEYVEDNRQIRNWFLPPEGWQSGRKGNIIAKLAWNGTNSANFNVGVFVWGYNNPYPDKKVKSIILEKSKQANTWFMLGITACDKKVVFPTDGTSFGIPDCWGAGAMVYSIIEGAIGIVDKGQVFNHVKIAPRWLAGGIHQAKATVCYPFSKGYASYTYHYDQASDRISLHCAFSADKSELSILLPKGSQVEKLKVNGQEMDFTINTIEESSYLDFSLTGRQARSIEIDLEN